MASLLNAMSDDLNLRVSIVMMQRVNKDGCHWINHSNPRAETL